MSDYMKRLVELYGVPIKPEEAERRFRETVRLDQWNLPEEFLDAKRRTFVNALGKLHSLIRAAERVKQRTNFV